MHPAALPWEELKQQSEVTRTRRGGPGGQHRNKVESAIVVEHRPTGIRGEASERRSQSENLAVAWQRLRVELALRHREPWPVERTPHPLWLSRVKGGKIAINPEHEDFGVLLADLLDKLAASEWDIGAAHDFGLSTSQAVKFLKLEPIALQMLNQQRTSRGLHALQ